VGKPLWEKNPHTKAETPLSFSHLCYTIFSLLLRSIKTSSKTKPFSLSTPLSEPPILAFQNRNAVSFVLFESLPSLLLQFEVKNIYSPILQQ